MTKKKLLEVKNLKQYFPIDKNSVVKAVDDITFHIYEGETFGLVGESGSGKSTLLHILGGIDKPTCGEVYIDGISLNGLSDDEISLIRLRKIG
ncbi:ATP-binding cassette domain-containing protein, partial [Turicibacter sanguinis]|nr:ATP-binding cassette domain-containing protein [Turicibacter sanguinis]